MDELSCGNCKKFIKNESVYVEADGKTIKCKNCYGSIKKTMNSDDKPALPKHGK
jgi:NAD-dependent SIR2 family protein deacetylase